MSLIIIGKVVLGTAAAAAVLVGGFFLHRLLNPNVEIYGLVDVDASATDLSMQCQINAEPFECKVEEVTKLTPDIKNHVLWSSVTGSEAKSLQGELNKQKFYKITIVESVFNEKAKEWNKHPVKIIKKDGSEIAWMTAVFAIKNKQVIKGDDQKPTLGKVSTTSFVGQASASITPTTGHKCSWETSSTVTDIKECKIYPFVANDDDDRDKSEVTDISVLTFKKTETDATQTKANHYYLITFTDDTYVQKDLEKWTSKEIVYLKNETDATTKATFKKLSAVKLIGDQLLILKKHI